mgnify:CR=1 FL=1
MRPTVEKRGDSGNRLKKLLAGTMGVLTLSGLVACESERDSQPQVVSTSIAPSPEASNAPATETVEPTTTPSQEIEQPSTEEVPVRDWEFFDIDTLTTDWNDLGEREKLIAADQFFEDNEPNFNFRAFGYEKKDVEAMATATLKKLEIIFDLGADFTDDRYPQMAVNLLETVVQKESAAERRPYELMKALLADTRQYLDDSSDPTVMAMRKQFYLSRILVSSDEPYPTTLAGEDMLTYNVTAKLVDATEDQSQGDENTTFTFRSAIRRTGEEAGGPTEVVYAFFGTDTKVQYNKGESKVLVSDAIAEMPSK